MTLVRAFADCCGEVDVPPASIQLDVLEEGTGALGCYRFVCPECLRLVSKPVNGQIAKLLIAAEVEVPEQIESVVDHVARGLEQLEDWVRSRNA